MRSAEQLIRSRTSARHPARWAWRLASAVLALLVSALAVELVARLWPPPTIHRWMIPDPVLGFRMPANARLSFDDEAGLFSYRLNSLGSRGLELPAENSDLPSSARILFVGDSFLNAWGVRDEDWVGTVVREKLRAGGVPAETFALSVDDFGTAQELMLLQEYGQRVRPRDVVLLLYPGNDLINNTLELAGRTGISPGDYFRPYLVLAGDGELRRCYARPWMARLRASRVFSWLEARWLARQDSSQVRARLVGRKIPSRAERVLAGQLPEEYLELFREPVPGGAWDTAWRTTEALLLAFREETERLGARPLVVVIPHPFQVEQSAYLGSLDRDFQKNGRAPLDELLDWNLPEVRLEAFFHRAGLRHIQLLDPLRQEILENGAPLYLSNGHLNGAGHALMGQLIASRLSASTGDVCFRALGAARPVDSSVFLRKRPLDLDFLAQPRRELFRSGWLDWRESSARGAGGWPLVSKGLLLAPAGQGTVTLRGRLTDDSGQPVEVTLTGAAGEELVRESFAAPGEFQISFAGRPPEGKKLWEPIWLAVADSSSTGEGDQLPRLFLTGMHFEP